MGDGIHIGDRGNAANAQRLVQAEAFIGQSWRIFGEKNVLDGKTWETIILEDFAELIVKDRLGFHVLDYSDSIFPDRFVDLFLFVERDRQSDVSFKRIAVRQPKRLSIFDDRFLHQSLMPSQIGKHRLSFDCCVTAEFDCCENMLLGFLKILDGGIGSQNLRRFQLSTVTGKVYLYDKVGTITRGVLTFDNPNVADPTLDIAVTFRINQPRLEQTSASRGRDVIDLNLTVSGKASEPLIQPQPPYTQQDVVSLMVANTTWGGGDTTTAKDPLADRLRFAATNVLFSEVQRVAARKLGIETLEISSNADPKMTQVLVGHSFSPHLYLYGSSPLDVGAGRRARQGLGSAEAARAATG